MLWSLWEMSKSLGKEIGTGEFGADMKVELLNNGPVTICMDTNDLLISLQKYSYKGMAISGFAA